MKIEYLSNILAAFLLLILTSCEPEPAWDPYHDGYGSESEKTDRLPVNEKRHVLLLYSAGFNSLSSFLQEDIQDIRSGWLPSDSRNEDVMLIYSHAVTRDYATPSSPVLFRVYKDSDGQVVNDTLVVYSKNTCSSSAGQLSEVLTYVKEEFPAKSYGMVFSSHATGYLPAGYYSSPSDYKFEWNMSYRSGHRDALPKPVPYVEPVRDPSLPTVKSIGQDLAGPSDARVSYEIELPEFAAALPMHMSYILFDSCLMGGVEVAYELREKCDFLGFSPTEVLSEGFDYRTLTTHLLSPEPDLKAVCEDYYNQYASQTGAYQSATISLVDCRRIEGLAGLCADLFEKYRTGLGLIAPERVQQYYTYSKHWFYDLESIIFESGRAERYYWTGRVKELTSGITSAGNDIESYERTLNEVSGQIAALDPESLEYESRYESLLEQQEMIQQMLAQQKEKLEGLKQELSEAEEELESITLVWDEYYAELIADIDDLHEKLDECIVYKAATERFLGMFDILTYSGLSMYLPCNGGPDLNKYYQTLAWNIRTELVK